MSKATAKTQTTTKNKTQTKADFIYQVAAKLNTTQKESTLFVNTILETLQETLAKGYDQAFVGFGTFTIKNRPARTGRHPNTGEPMAIKAKRVAVFKALKEAVSSSN